MFTRSKSQRAIDMDLVSEASGVLEISDFEFWKLASHHANFDFPQRTLEHMFGHFLAFENSKMPPFVGAFALDVLDVSVDDARCFLDTNHAYLIA